MGRVGGVRNSLLDVCWRSLYAHVQQRRPRPAPTSYIRRICRRWAGCCVNMRGRAQPKRGAAAGAAVDAAAAARRRRRRRPRRCSGDTPDGGTRVIPGRRAGARVRRRHVRGARLVRLVGTPRARERSYAADPTCHHAGAEAILRKACRAGRTAACRWAPTMSGRPRHDQDARRRRRLPPARRHADALPPLVLAAGAVAAVRRGHRVPRVLELPEVAPASLVPNGGDGRHVVAADLQHFVVHNVHNTTGWPSSSSTARRTGRSCALFATSSAAAPRSPTSATTTWRTGSVSSMLLDVFWKAAIGRKVLIFQPDSIMCAAPPKIVRSPGTSTSARRWRGRTGRPRPQLAVGRRLRRLLAPRPRQVDPDVEHAGVRHAGELEDQQLGAGWKYIEKRCAAARSPSKPTAQGGALRDQYDLHGRAAGRRREHARRLHRRVPHVRQVRPGADAQAAGAADPGGTRTQPDPNVRCERRYVPLGCHKWVQPRGSMRTHCPEVLRMRQLRKTYQSASSSPAGRRGQAEPHPRRRDP